MMKNIKSLKQFFALGLLFILLFGLVGLVVAPLTAPLLKFSIVQVEYTKSIVVLLALGLVPLAFYLHNKKLAQMNDVKNPDERFLLYMKGFRQKLMLLVLVSVIAVIAYILTKHSAFLYILLLALVAYLLNIPSGEKIEDLLLPPVEEETESEDTE